jgi:hypothetical protein
MKAVVGLRLRVRILLKTMAWGTISNLKSAKTDFFEQKITKVSKG